MVELTGDNDKNKKDIYYKLRMVCMYYIHNLSKHSHSPCFFFFFQKGSQVSQAGLKFAVS